jgi:hypothetical protein
MSPASASSDAPATASAAWRVKPPAKSASAGRIARSSSSSRRQECSKAARRLRWRDGTSRAGVARKSRLRSISAAISSQLNMRTQAAASSMPSGMPSTVWQMRTTAG